MFKRSNKLQSSELKRVFDTNDIICITESWGDESQNFDYDGFEHFELHRTENKVTCTRNSGGIVVYFRDYLVDYGIFVMKRNDTHIWFKLNSNHFNFDKDFYLCVCYIPPSNSSRQGLNEFNPYDELMNNILYLQENTNENCNFMIVGDLNSRISKNLTMFVMIEISI